MNSLTGYWSLIYQIPVGLLGLSFMVFIHELGHFLAAKWSGVGVHTFSIGFGKKILKYQRGGTEYCISAIPFGGYIAMAGEDPEDGGYGNSDAFRGKSIPVRIFIAAAGPLVNLIFAILILFGLYLVGVQEPKYSMIVGQIEKNSAAEKAGVLKGDEILTFGGKAIKDWEVFVQDAAMEAGKAIPMHIRRGTAEMDLMLTPEMDTRFGIALTGILGEWEVSVNKVMPGMPAQLGGLLAGDVIENIEGTRIPSSTALIEMVNGSKGEKLNFNIRRGETQVTIPLSPKYDESSKRFLIGIYPANVIPTHLVQRGIVESFTASLDKTWDNSTMVFRTFGKILTGQIQLKALSGPIGIVQMIAGSLRQSAQKFLEFMAMLNTNLGVLNLLPLAITDGGLILFLIIEAIRRKPLGLRTQGVINRVGVTFFMVLALFVTFHDILRIPWFLN